MTDIFRRLARAAAVLSLLAAAPASAAAQGPREREVRPAFDFKRIQMPVEVVSVRLGGKELQPGEKIRGGDDWLRGVSFTLRNVSDRPLAYVELALHFPRPQGSVAFILNYGVDYSRRSPRLDSSPPAIPPGGTLQLTLTRERYPSFLRILDMGGIDRGFDTAAFYVERVCFEGEPDVIWAGGMLKRRDPERPTEFITFERYALPAGRR